jgi:hypothetical protein
MFILLAFAPYFYFIISNLIYIYKIENWTNIKIIIKTFK